MARSPLFRALKRFVSEHAAAADQGVGVARIREEIGRGDFLRRAGAASLASAAVPLFAACGSSHARGRERIAIVGAGIAGLTAALHLKDAGIDSTVYESSDHVGGRMHSNWTLWDDRQHTEWCGAMIDSDHRTIRGLAARFKVPLLDTIAAWAPGARDTAVLSRSLLSDGPGRPRLRSHLSDSRKAARRDGRNADLPHGIGRGEAARPHEHAAVAADVRSGRRAVAARTPDLRGLSQRVRPRTLGAERRQLGEHARGTEEVFEERRADQRARLFGSALYDLDGQPAYSDGDRGRSPGGFDSVEQPHDGDSPNAERHVRADHRLRRNEADGNTTTE